MHVLITGASKGIGLALAQRFCADDTRISICSRSKHSIREAKATIERSSPGALVYAAACDVSQETEVTRFLHAAESALGPVDVLINNAGFGIFRSVLDMTVHEFDRVLATNLRGVFLMTQAVLPGMKQRRSGTVVTISSLAGRNGFAGGSAYCASKFGVRGLMQSLFLEARASDIRVITVFPGSVNTAFFETAGHPLGERAKTVLSPEDIADSVYAAVHLPPRATISELDIRPTNPAG